MECHYLNADFLLDIRYGKTRWNIRQKNSVYRLGRLSICMMPTREKYNREIFHEYISILSYSVIVDSTHISIF